ncbi:MAG: efflux RND transporter periplasmic adaptor subunit [Myxococcota bacterium]
MRCAVFHHRGARLESARARARLAFLTACVLPLAFAAGCSGEREGSGARSGDEVDVVVVEVVRLVPEAVIHTAALTGQFEAASHVVVKSEIEGVIDAIEFLEGRTVEAGDILFRLRDGEQKAKRKAALAALRLAQDVYDRTQRLAQRDVSSAARGAEASARLDGAQAHVDLAEVELERTRIRAPFTGITGLLTTEIGDRVEEENGLVSLTAVDRLQLVFTVPELGVALARVGRSIHARVIAWPGERFPGTVFFVSPTIDPSARRLVLKAWVDNPERKLKPGMFANIDVELAHFEAALMAPESALVHDRNGRFVWRVGEDERVEKVPVEIGIREGGRVQLLSGVAAGERIISAGTNKVLAGDRVEALEPASDGHAAGPFTEEVPKARGDDT